MWNANWADGGLAVMVESQLHSCLVRLYSAREPSVNGKVIANSRSEPLDAIDSEA